MDLAVTQRLSGVSDGRGNALYTDWACDNTDQQSDSEERKKAERRKKKKEEADRKDAQEKEPVSRRHTMLPQEIEIFNNNQTISGLGMDVMAARGGNAPFVK